MSTPKPAVITINTASIFAQHLLLIVPFTEGTGQPGIVRGADGVTADAPTTTVWTGTPATWTTNSAGACVTGVGATPLRLGDDATSGSWLPTGDCTIGVVLGKTGSVTGGFAVTSDSGTTATTLRLAVPRNNNNVQWGYGSSGSGNPIEGGSAGGWATDPPDTVVVTAGAAGFAIYKNGVKVASSATARSRTASTTSLVLLGTTGITSYLNYFQINAAQWDEATAMAWSSDPYNWLVPTGPRRSGFGAQKPTRRHRIRP